MLDIYGKIITIEFLERIRDEKKFNGIEELKNQRDVTKADFYKGLKDYDRFIEEQKSFKRDDLYDDRIEMSAKDVLEIVKTFNEDEKLAFWLEYFTLADKFIYVPQSETSGKGQMGE